MPGTALHVSPHPDDEVLGCGATLLALRRAGWRVVNLACSLGRVPDRDRRRAELEAAVEVMGLESVVADPLVAMSVGSGDDLGRAEARVVRLVGELAGEISADLLISPHPEDGHPAHAAVGRAVARVSGAGRWWAWSFWRDLPAPNRYVPYGPEDLGRLLEALGGHAGEVARQPYADGLAARARLQAVIGSERVCGFGSAPASPQPYADLLEERVGWPGSGWHLARGHVVGLGDLVDPDPDGRDGGADALVHGVGDGP